MKKINLKGISEILSEKEMKNVMGGSGEAVLDWCGLPGDVGPDPKICWTKYGVCSSCMWTGATYQCYLPSGLFSNC